MGLITKEVEVKLSGNNIKWYEDKGYVIPRRTDINYRVTVPRGSLIIVKIEDIPNESNIKVDCICDGCGELLTGIIWQSYKKYVKEDGKYYCQKCGSHEFKRWESLKNTHPDLLKYLKNKEDSLLSANSNKRIEVKCCDCGCEKEMILQTLTKKGICCTVCGKGFYPEKFMFNFLSQLSFKNIINSFETQKKFTWCKFQYNNKDRTGTYDFYFESDNKKYIIETDGGWHKKKNNLSGQTKEESIFIDKEKDNLAYEHQIEVIRINCDKSELDWIKKNILNSKILDILNINKNEIDWLKCHEFACSSSTKKVCESWNKGLNINEIALTLKKDRNTIRRYLKHGAELGWCNYNPKEEFMNCIKINATRNSKKVVCINTDEIFDSLVLASEKIGLKNPSSIGRCCRHKTKYSGMHPTTGEKLKWMYLDEYIEIVNNETLVC